LKKRSEAKASIWRFRSCAARCTTLPTTIVVREATVGPELGASPVSAIGKRKCAGSSESASAAICVKDGVHALAHFRGGYADVHDGCRRRGA
jgi:hypothetical protein